MNLTVPTFADNQLLSATALNMLTTATNAISGAAASPAAVFTRRGVNQTWYMRRRYRYLHVAYSVTPNSGSVTVSIAFGTSTGNQWTHSSAVAWQWRTFDLNAVGGTTVGAWYGITVNRSGTNYAFETILVMESEDSNPNSVGTYTPPPTWSSLEAVGATKLNTLATCITNFTSVVTAQSVAALRGTLDGQSYTLRRRGRWLEITITTGGTGFDINVYVHQTKVLNDPPSGTYTIDLAALSPAPPVGSWYQVRFEKLAGSGELVAFREIADTPTSYAPTWTHGQSNFLTNLNSYAGLLDAAQVVLGKVGWQPAALYRPYDHPIWFGWKTARYLHYMRNGSTPASIVDPSGGNSSVGLQRTTSQALFATYDLDSIDWLAPGGLFYVYEADVVFLSEEP